MLNKISRSAQSLADEELFPWFFVGWQSGGYARAVIKFRYARSFGQPMPHVDCYWKPANVKMHRSVKWYLLLCMATYLPLFSVQSSFDSTGYMYIRVVDNDQAIKIISFTPQICKLFWTSRKLLWKLERNPWTLRGPNKLEHIFDHR